ncbi:MAG: peroxiredoxin family protein [Planctomycetota bacterium]|jgi:thiol-disulfide isomerase/thioredoxin
MRIAAKALLAGCLTLLVIVLLSDRPARATNGSPEEGIKLLHEVAQAYQNAPAMTDEVRVETKSRLGSGRQRMSVAVGAGVDAEIRMDGYVVTVVDERFYVYREDLPRKFFAAPLEGDFVATFQSLSGGAVPPVPHCILRYGHTLEDYLPAFGMSRASNLKLVGHRMADDGGQPVHEIQFTGDGGASVKALIDPESKYIRQIEIAGGQTELKASMNPKRLDRLPQPVAFDETGRRQVDDMRQLGLGKGDAAPDFTLETLDGQRVTLSEQRGSVVVLDFWASWCGPCRWSLAKLQDFATWAESSGLDVKVFAVNIGERKPTNEQKREIVEKYWTSQAFTMPTLLDFEDSAARAYEVGPIPHTVVVGPDGTIIEVETGFNPQVGAHLEKVVKRALQVSG